LLGVSLALLGLHHHERADQCTVCLASAANAWDLPSAGTMLLPPSALSAAPVHEHERPPLSGALVAAVVPRGPPLS
jgi:hypothetical protein